MQSFVLNLAKNKMIPNAMKKSWTTSNSETNVKDSEKKCKENNESSQKSIRESINLEKLELKASKCDLWIKPISESDNECMLKRKIEKQVWRKIYTDLRGLWILYFIQKLINWSLNLQINLINKYIYWNKNKYW